MLRNGKRLSLSLIGMLALLLLVFHATSVSAAPEPATYDWLIGGPFFEPFGVGGPDIAIASDGATIAVLGEGTLSIHSKSVSGGGTFTQTDASGSVVAAGTWTAEQLLSFDPYGTAPPDSFINVYGGKALIRIHLSPAAGGPGVDAVLRITCVAGFPPPSAEEGIELAVEGGPNFNRNLDPFAGEGGGATAFMPVP
jgi:hypothetical protein